jgi:hypothetical protein
MSSQATERIRRRRPAATVDARAEALTPRLQRAQRLTAADLLALQRTAGNQAARALARRADRRMIARWTNLKLLAPPAAEEDAELWSLFVTAQKILLDAENVKLTLQLLEKLSADSSVTDVLAASEKGAYSDRVPSLIGFVPPETFNAILAAGEQFEDLVAPAHGRKSHRIQWFVLAQYLPNGLKDAARLYRAAADPKWDAVIHPQGVPLNEHLWDLIVDAVPRPQDPLKDKFIAPDSVQAELMGGKYGALTVQAQAEYDQLATDQAMWNKRRPQTVNDLAANGAVLAFAKTVPKDDTHLIYRDEGEKSRFMAGVVNQRVQHNGYEWTGWIPVTYEPFLIATVAYPLKAGPAPIVKKEKDCVIM